MPTPIAAGDTVRLTAKFLRNTGQHASSDAHKRWTVRACPCGLCRGGRFVAVDESSGSFFTADEIAREPHLAWRHFNAANLYRIGTLTHENAA